MTKKFSDQHLASFAPFAALEGFSAALEEKRKEHVLCQRPVLMPDRAEEIEATLQALACGDFVSVRYWDSQLESISGEVMRIDSFQKCLRIGEIKIRFATIIDLEVSKRASL